MTTHTHTHTHTHTQNTHIVTEFFINIVYGSICLLSFCRKQMPVASSSTNTHTHTHTHTHIYTCMRSHMLICLRTTVTQIEEDYMSVNNTQNKLSHCMMGICAGCVCELRYCLFKSRKCDGAVHMSFTVSVCVCKCVLLFVASEEQTAQMATHTVSAESNTHTHTHTYTHTHTHTHTSCHIISVWVDMHIHKCC